ncbi:unnamed protein product [Cochlearia groenlandica]
MLKCSPLTRKCTTGAEAVTCIADDVNNWWQNCEGVEDLKLHLEVGEHQRTKVSTEGWRDVQQGVETQDSDMT